VRELRAGRVLAEGAAPAAAVQLLTVHGAKGLEARTVVVVDADPTPRPALRATLLVDWPVEAAAPQRIAFLRSESAVPPSLAPLLAGELAAAQREELNGLYVAMTRARERLVFSRTEPHRSGPTRSWWARVHEQAEPWEPVLDADATGAGPAPPIFVPVLPALAPHAAGEVAPEAQDAAAARLGQAVHRLLEWAGRPGLAPEHFDLPGAARAAAAAFGLSPAAAARVLTVAGQILQSPACAAFFHGPALRWAGNEVPVAEGGELLRIDRLVLLNEPGAAPTWWVLDYKLQTGATSLPLYREQLRRYVRAVAALQPGDAVRGALITGAGDLLPIEVS
jgi:ATP-dependent helicase/nuclease subunit A